MSTDKLKFDYPLGTISQALNWRTPDNKIVSYEPYVREMRIWASLFRQVDIFAPLSNEKIRVTVSEYGFSNIDFSFVSYSNTIKWWGAILRFVQLPIVLGKLIVFIWNHDVLLIRSPSHFGLFAHILVWLLRKKSITKYAGYFSFFDGERMPSIIERNFIRWVLAPPHYALVYGPSNARHLISFIPAAISKPEIAFLKSLRNDVSDANRKLTFYSLGKLTPVKNFELAIQSFGLLFRERPDLYWEYHLIGDGVELNSLTKLCEASGIKDRVFFEGKLSYDNSMRKLVSADIVIMPGVKEGWPKVVIEGWAVGAVPLVAEAGISSFIIKDSVNGFLFKPEPAALKNRLIDIFNDLHSLSGIKKTGWEEVERFSLEKFSSGIEDICRSKLNL